LGYSELPVIRIEHLTEAQLRAVTIADNRLTELSVWDERMLGKELKFLSDLELDFSLEVTGFTLPEIDLKIQNLSTAEAEDAADQLPAPSPIVVSKPDDLWTLGRHRIFNGNALENTSYLALMQGEKAAVVFTDPPFNVPIAGHASGLGRTQHRDFIMASGEMSQEQFIEFLTNACTLLANHAAPGTIFFICMDWRHAWELLAAGRTAFTTLLNVCVWAKSNAGMGSLYRSQHEWVFVFKNGKDAHRNNVQLGKYGRNRSNVWQYPNISAFGRSSGSEGNLQKLHPTVKPVALVSDAILDVSVRGDVVLDAFLGSGSTLIAAERTGRQCRGIEMDPGYVDTAIRRWQAYTGEKATHAVTGRPFDELAAEMGAQHVEGE
jgi:DNA modification methylase